LFARARAGEEGALALLVQMYLGLRPSEVLALTVDCVGEAGRRVAVPGTKTRNAKRQLELYAEVGELLAKHCDGKPGTQRVFAANLLKQPAPNWMYKRLHKYCDDAGIERICPHALRGLHSSLALTAGATTQDVARALGHASFSTTQRHYASPESVINGRSARLIQRLHTEEPAPNLDAALAMLPAELRGQVLAALGKKGTGAGS
jgi:integrase